MIGPGKRHGGVETVIIIQCNRSCEGSFLNGSGNIFIVSKTNNTAGYVLVGCTLLGNISGVDGSTKGLAKINVYRAGYTKEDNLETPVKSFNIKSSVILILTEQAAAADLKHCLLTPLTNRDF